MKQNRLFLFLTLLGMVISCTNDQRPDISEAEEPANNSYVVSVDAALDELQCVLNDMHGNTRSVGRDVKEVQILRKGDVVSTRSEVEDSDCPLAYVVNFENGGYAVLGADVRQTPVIAVVGSGEMTPEVLVNAKRVVDAGEQVDTPTYFNALVENYIETAPSDPDNQARIIGPPATGDWKVAEYQDHLTVTNWDQGFPFNKYCIEDGVVCPAGCTPLAVVQVLVHNHMYYGTGPTSIGSYVPDWTRIDFYARYPYKVYAEMSGNDADFYKDAVAKFVHKIGVVLDTEYTSKSSRASFQHVAPLLQSVSGYTNIQEIRQNKSGESAMKQAIREMVFVNKVPVPMTGTIKNSSGHTWVVDGWQLKQKPYGYGQPNAYYTQTFVYCNFGWNGTDDDRLYEYGIFDTHMGSLTEGFGIVKYTLNK